MMAINVKGIALLLLSSVEQIALPFDAAGGVQVAVGAANEIANDDCIQRSTLTLQIPTTGRNEVFKLVF